MSIIKKVDYRIIRESNGWFVLELKYKFLCFSWWHQPCGFSSYVTWPPYGPKYTMEAIEFLIAQAKDDMKEE